MSRLDGHWWNWRHPRERILTLKSPKDGPLINKASEVHRTLCVDSNCVRNLSLTWSSLRDPRLLTICTGLALAAASKSNIVPCLRSISSSLHYHPQAHSNWSTFVVVGFCIIMLLAFNIFIVAVLRGLLSLWIDMKENCLYQITPWLYDSRTPYSRSIVAITAHAPISGSSTVNLCPSSLNTPTYPHEIRKIP